MPSETFSKLKKLMPKKKFILVVVTTAAVVMLILSAVFLRFENRIFPNTFVSSVDVGKLTRAEAIEKIKTKIPETINLTSNDSFYPIDLSEIDFSTDYQKTVDKIIENQKSEHLFDSGSKLFRSFNNQSKFEYEIYFDREKLEGLLALLGADFYEPEILPIVRKSDQKVIVNKGNPGKSLDIKYTTTKIVSNLKFANFDNVQIQIENITSVDQKKLDYALELSDKLANKFIVLNYKDYSQSVGDLEVIKSLLETPSHKSIVEKIETDLNTQPQNARFVYEESQNSNKVHEFSPAKEGVKVDTDKLLNLINQLINNLSTTEEESLTIQIPVQTAFPEVTTESVNSLGIKELIGKGESRFVGSISSRVHNIGVASANFNGLLVKPGEIISFNQVVGDITSLTGYKQAYIIKDGATVLGDGGGVCQVSTTLFRAALDAGLPIVERRAHSYRVTYYEQGSPPGLDATVYSPVTDLKIKNDTQAYMLIQTIYDPKNMTLKFEIYGTSDGRVSTLSKPIVTNVIPPPEDSYVDDPNLKQGEVKQIDWKAWGARVSFDYKVERNGETIYEKTFLSNYRPWQAKFLRGTAPIN